MPSLTFLYVVYPVICINISRAISKPYESVIQVPHLLFMKTAAEGSESFDHFKEVTLADTDTFIKNFTMDCKPKNEELGKRMDDAVKEIICSRVSLA